MNVLVLASESPARLGLCRALARRGHQATVVEDVQVAFAHSAAEPPEMIWIEAARAEAIGPLRSVVGGRPCAIVVLGVGTSAISMDRLLAAGADDCLSEPVDEPQLDLRLSIVEHRIRAQQEARSVESIYEARFRSLFEVAPLGIAVSDLTGRIRQCNPRFAEMLGYAPEQCIGRQIQEFTHPDELETGRRQFRELVAGVRQTLLMEKGFCHRNGRTVWGLVSASVTRDHGGRPVSVISMIQDVSERHQARQEVLKEQNLLRQLLELHERDRQLIAFELHDGFAQQLTGAMFNFQAFRELFARDPTAAWKGYDAGLRLISQSIDESRRLVSGLCPPVLEEFGIVPAVENLIAGKSRPEGPTIELVCHGRLPRLARPLENAVFRIVQEALANACRHSGSDQVRVELVRGDHRLTICVEDWGVGFDPQEICENRFGLLGVRERARLLAGSATIESAPGKGARVRVTLPLLPRAEAEE